MNIFIKKLIDPKDKKWFTFILYKQGKFDEPIATLTEAEIRFLLGNIEDEIKVK